MAELIEAIWKSIVVFALLILVARFIGRKLLSQFTFFDFVIGISIGTITGAFVATTVKGAWVLVSPIVLATLAVATGFLATKSLAARKIIEGEPVIAIQNGKVLERNMAKLRYNMDDLESHLRNKNIFDITQVEFAVLEPQGTLSVLKKSQDLPVTMRDLGKPTKYKGMATEIIKDGDVLEQNLQQNGLSTDWLEDQLNQRGFHVRDVFYAALQTDGTLYIDPLDDQLKEEIGYIQRTEDDHALM